MPDRTVVNFVVGGFCSGEATHKPLCTELEQISGNKTIYVDSLRWGDCERIPRKTQYATPLDLQARHIACRITEALDDLRLGRRFHQAANRRNPDDLPPVWYDARIFGHSFGAAASMLTATDYLPSRLEDFDTVSLRPLAPACFRKEGWQLAGRTFRKGLNDRRMIRENKFPEICEIMALGGPGMRRYMANLPRTIAEGIMLTRTDIYTALRGTLADRKISVLTAYAEHDELFPELPDHPRDMTNAMVLKGVTHDVQYHPKTVVAQLADTGYL